MKTKIVATLLLLAMLIGITSMTQINADAASIVKLNDSSVFLKQQTNTTCTLASALMMFRRGALLNESKKWDTFTEANYKSSWWTSDGLKFTLSGLGMTAHKRTIKPGGDYNYSLGTGSASSRKTWFADQLKKHKEGIVIYFFDGKVRPHAVLLTDYTSGTFYCSDPSSSASSGRIPLASSTLYNRIKSAGYKEGSLSKQDFILSYIPQLWILEEGISGNTTITYSSISGPGTITQGSKATIYGTISSTNSNLKTIQAVVTNSSGKSVLSASVSVNTNSYKLAYSDLDYKLTFAKLAKGNYTLTYTATTADGKKESKSVSFKVNAAKTTVNFNSMSGPGTIRKGSKATIYGTISSTNSNLKTIKAVVTNSSGKAVLSGSVSVNTNSYKLAYSDLDYKLTFAILAKGNYTLTYTATTADGTSNTYSTSFKVK